jgi:hypothetical protein
MLPNRLLMHEWTWQTNSVLWLPLAIPILRQVLFQDPEVTMHHPVQFETMAKIKQMEFLKEAANQRAIQSAQVDDPRVPRRWLALALAFVILVVGLVLLTGMFWAG